MSNPSGMNDLIIEFLTLVLLVYVITVSVYLITGFLLVKLKENQPDRTIQSREPTLTTRQQILGSLRALIIVAFCTGGGLFVQYKGWGMAPLELTPFTFVLLFIVGVILNDAWFYLTHRLLHTKTLFFLHKRHHQCITPTAWSNDYFDTFDIFIQHVYFFFITFLIPIPTLALIAIRIYDQIKGMIGHSGIELFASRFTRSPFPVACVVFHDDHHSKFHCNYSNTFTFWDRVFGTIDPEYDQRVTEYLAQGKFR